MTASSRLVSLSPHTEIRVEGEHASLARAAQYLRDAVKVRTGLDWTVGTSEWPNGTITLRLDEGPEPQVEKFRMSISEDAGRVTINVEISAVSVVLAAVGHLARSFAYGDGSVQVALGDHEHEPAYPLRAQVLSNHKQTNTFDLWTLEQWDERLTELAALGNNLVVVYPAHPSRWHGALPYADDPWFDNEARRHEWQRQYEIQMQVPIICHELGIRYGAYISPNDVWPEEVARNPEWAPNSHAFVCPAKPAARGAINALRSRLFRDLPHLDVLFIPSKDDGGCPGCVACDPWASTYIDVVQEQAELARGVHPNVKIWLSQQGLPWDQTKKIADWLSVDSPEYVEAVAYGPFSEAMLFDAPDVAANAPSAGNVLDHHWDGPRRLRELLPPEVPIVLYPDEVHSWRAQYPLIEAHPTIQYVWFREDAPVPRVRDTVEQFTNTIVSSGGAAPYSEGDTDDVNKFVWSVLLWEPTLSPEDVALRYGRWYLGGDGVAEAALLLSIEAALSSTDPFPHIRRAQQQLLEASAALPDRTRNSWRWMSLEYAGGLLQHIAEVHGRDRNLAANLRFRIAAWFDDPDFLPGLRSVIDYLRTALQSSDPGIERLDQLRHRLDESHRLRMRSAVRIQRSYHGFDHLLTELEELEAELSSQAGSDFPWQTARERVLASLSTAEQRPFQYAEGQQVLPHLTEFSWETGATRWHSR